MSHLEFAPRHEAVTLEVLDAVLEHLMTAGPAGEVNCGAQGHANPERGIFEHG